MLHRPPFILAMPSWRESDALALSSVEFDLVARLDKGVPYSKVALILSLYLCGGETTAPKGWHELAALRRSARV